MAIQIPNPGTGNGASGDNEFVLWSKVKDNFTDQTNAASKLVGRGATNIPLVTDVAFAVYSTSDTFITEGTITGDMNTRPIGERLYASRDVPNSPVGMGRYNHIRTIACHAQKMPMQISTPAFGSTGLATRNSMTATGADASSESWTSWSYYYGTHNTLKDSNGFIKAASPTVQVFADKVELNDDAVKQNVTYKKNGVGDYTITTVSGLSTDGWYIELPKDLNGNPKVAVTLSEVDGVISLKSYKRIFSMETFTFEPDLDNPLDIPDTRWIDLRLNEIPVEYEDDAQAEV